MGWLIRSGWALVLVAASGCTLVFSGDEHQGGITAPEVEIQPTDPGTLDDLEAVIVTSSEAPDDAPVTYEHQWFLGDETEPRVTGATLPSTMTEKGQVWTVVVTPGTADRTGQAGEASVTIVNTPPKVLTVGLSRYRPVTEDVVTAYPVVRDPDGDPVTLAFEWIRNGSTPVAAVTGDAIDLGERGFAAGDTVEARVTASDDESAGETGTGGPVPVAQAVTGWRPLMPSRFQSRNDGNAMVLDSDDHRLVLLAGHQLWELPLDAPRRYVRLVAQGEAPEGFKRAEGTFVAEPEEAHLFVVQKDGSVYRLDLERAAESWTRLSDADPDPDAVLGALSHPTVFVDRSRGRLVLYDHTGLYEHPLQGGAWSRVEQAGASPSVIGAAWLHEPGTDVAHLIGGAPPAATADDFEGATDQVWALDLTTDTFELLDTPAPGTKVWPATAVDVDGRKGYVIEGASSVSATVADGFGLGDATLSPAVWELDFETGEWRVVTDAEGPIAPRMFGTASFDPAQGRILHTSGSSDRDWRSDVVAIDPATGDRTAVDVNGVHVPLAVCDAAYAEVRDDRLLIVGGEGPGFDPVADMWAYSMIEDGWTRLEAVEDPVHGAPPPASGMGFHSAPVIGPVLLFGGDDDVDVLDATWELSVGATTASWSRVTTTAVPPARQQAAILDTCDLVYGGRGASVLDDFTDTWSLSCSSGTCDYDQVVTGGGSFPNVPASASRLVNTQSSIIAVGGDSRFDPMEVHSTPRCPGAADEWIQETVALAAGNASPPQGRDSPTVTPGGLGTTEFLLHAGNNTDNSTWELRFEDGGWVWNELTPAISEAYPEPSDRTCHAAAWHEDASRLVIFGGETPTKANDVWELRFVP